MIVSGSKSGLLDSRFVTLVKQLREPLVKYGFGMYKGTALDTIAMMETGDRETATVQLGMQIDDSGIRSCRSAPKPSLTTTRPRSLPSAAISGSTSGGVVGIA
jgi:hypothetical protein